jgi:hypothetical protein
MLHSLADVQAEFAAALRDPNAGMPEGVSGPDGAPAPRRFAVYRNNVIVGLVNAVASAFPAVKRIVGDEFFTAMARAYVVAEPPTSPVLMDYGASFADFIAGFGPAASLPYLPDIARIERAWREAYHAEEARTLDAADFAGLAEVDLPNVKLRLHPSVRLVRSSFPSITIWRMNVGDGPVTPVDFSVAEDALIVRPDAEVEVRVVPPGGAEFVASLDAGESLGAAAVKGLSAVEGFDLAGNISGLIAAGALCAIIH